MQMDSKLKPWRTNSSNMPQLGTFGDSFTPSWAQWRRNMGNIASNEASSIAKNVANTSENGRFEDFGLGRLCPHFLKPYGTSLWDLGPSCAFLEPSWKSIGPSWAESWGLAGRGWANVAAMSDRNGACGRFWADLQNVQITSPVHFLASCSVENAPPPS